MTSPKGATIYIFMNMLVNRRFQELLRKVITEQYKPSALQFVPNIMLPLYISGCFSGIVIDCGFVQTEALAVIEGVPIKRSLDYLPIGASKVIFKALELYKESTPLSVTLKDLMESDFDTLNEICVGFSADEDECLQDSRTETRSGTRRR